MIGNLIAISPLYINYACIILVPARPKRFSQRNFITNQIQVFGPSQFMKVSSLYILRKFLNAISYRQYSVIKVAKNNHISVLKTDSLKSEELLKKIRTLSLDIILSVASSRIFGPSMLSIPKLGCLNVHAGILPRYRGINPSFWSLLNQEKQSAVTVHYMNEEIDDGEIIQQDFFDIRGVNTLHGVYSKVQEIAPKTILKALGSINEGDTRIIKNERSNSTYFSFPTKEDGRKFRAMGLNFM
jgi:methionyl-tRNA formyltransferase